jgi:hypothetical protein
MNDDYSTLQHCGSAACTMAGLQEGFDVYRFERQGFGVASLDPTT